MTQEQKDLLFKDLCSRLPYEVKVATTDNDDSLENVWEALWYNTFTEDIKLIKSIDVDVEKIVDISEIKPYLFPLSSMTEQQKEELIKIINTGQNDNNEFMRSLCRIEFYHKNNFDYHNLIPMDLANDATNLNIY